MIFQLGLASVPKDRLFISNECSGSLSDHYRMPWTFFYSPQKRVTLKINILANLVYHKILNVSHQWLTRACSLLHVTHTMVVCVHKCCLVYELWYSAAVASFEVTNPLPPPTGHTDVLYSYISLFLQCVFEAVLQMSSCFLHQLLNYDIWI